jgi:hypothetical protein
MLYARLLLSVNTLLVAIGLAACARDEEGGRLAADAAVAGADTSPDTLQNASVLNNPDTAGWTAGLTAKVGSGGMTILEAVRTATHDEYERIVFAFAPGSLPGYKVEYIDRPIRQCGSGEVVDMPGDAWLSIRMEPAQAHTDAGAPTIADRARTLNYENMKALKMICDFEGQVEWVAAVAAPNQYRTLELKEPPRLVIDIKK